MDIPRIFLSERVHLREVRESDCGVWIRVSACNAPVNEPPLLQFKEGQVLIIEIIPDEPEDKERIHK